MSSRKNSFKKYPHFPHGLYHTHCRVIFSKSKIHICYAQLTYNTTTMSIPVKKAKLSHHIPVQVRFCPDLDDDIYLESFPSSIWKDIPSKNPSDPTPFVTRLQKIFTSHENFLQDLVPYELHSTIEKQAQHFFEHIGRTIAEHIIDGFPMEVELNNFDSKRIRTWNPKPHDICEVVHLFPEVLTCGGEPPIFESNLFLIEECAEFYPCLVPSLAALNVIYEVCPNDVHWKFGTGLKSLKCSVYDDEDYTYDYEFPSEMFRTHGHSILYHLCSNHSRDDKNKIIGSCPASVQALQVLICMEISHGGGPFHKLLCHRDIVDADLLSTCLCNRNEDIFHLLCAWYPSVIKYHDVDDEITSIFSFTSCIASTPHPLPYLRRFLSESSRLLARRPLIKFRNNCCIGTEIVNDNVLNSLLHVIIASLVYHPWENGFLFHKFFLDTNFTLHRSVCELFLNTTDAVRFIDFCTHEALNSPRYFRGEDNDLIYSYALLHAAADGATLNYLFQCLSNDPSKFFRLFKGASHPTPSSTFQLQPFRPIPSNYNRFS